MPYTRGTFCCVKMDEKTRTYYEIVYPLSVYLKGWGLNIKTVDLSQNRLLYS